MEFSLIPQDKILDHKLFYCSNKSFHKIKIYLSIKKRNFKNRIFKTIKRRITNISSWKFSQRFIDNWYNIQSVFHKFFCLILFRDKQKDILTRIPIRFTELTNIFTYLNDRKSIFRIWFIIQLLSIPLNSIIYRSSSDKLNSLFFRNKY